MNSVLFFRPFQINASQTELLVGVVLQAEFDQRPEWGATFMSLAKQCQSVLCCRVTPGQKASVVSLVRKHTDAVTMSIGDGANDVNMIKSKLIEQLEEKRVFATPNANLPAESIFYSSLHFSHPFPGISGSCWCRISRGRRRPGSAECRLCIVTIQIPAEAPAGPWTLVLQAHFPLLVLFPV